VPLRRQRLLKRHHALVTPEVVGSSPVAPVLFIQAVSAVDTD
jgi:hypothetical protein